MVRVKTGTVALLILILIIAAYILVPRAPPIPKGGVLVAAQSKDADVLDIHLTVYDPATRVIGLVHDTLMTFDWDMSWQPLLAKSWEVAPDGLSVIFQLREDVKFHCGQPFNAEAVRYSVLRAKTHPRSKHKASVGMVLDVEVVDNYTARIHLEEEDRWLVDWFATTSSSIVCPRCAELYREDYGVSKFCGTGPFKVKEWIRDDRIVLERNDEYAWGPARYKNRGPAHLDGITFRVIPESLVQEAELEAGRVHMLGGGGIGVTIIPRAELLERWKKDPNMVFIQRPYSSMVYVGLNVSSPTLTEPPTPKHAGAKYSLPPTARATPVNDVRVRKALQHATHQENIVKYVYEGIGRPADQYLTSTIWGYDPRLANMYPYDPEKARNLLKEAGYEAGLKLEMLTLSTEPYPRIAEMLKEQWKVIGVDLEIKVVEFGYLIDQITKCVHDMWILDWTWHNADMVWWFWHRVRLPPGPNRFWWGSYYSDLVIENTFLLDDNKALEAIYESCRLIMEDAGYIPLVERALLIAHRIEVEGFEAHPLGSWCWKLLDTYLKM